jgi:hypothetical protein
MGDEHVKEASSVAQIVAGFSAYYYGVGYSLEQLTEELDAIVEHIKKAAQG